MAKIYGLFGSMQGKVADVVMAVRNGEQIVRKYQPIVSNPKSTAQLETRAKLKLLSQMSAVFAPVIALPREGAVSSRNRFTSINFPSVSYANSKADMDMLNVKLTKSVVGLPAITATRTEQNLSMQLAYSDADLNRVVYVVIIRQPDNSIRLVDSVVATTAGTENKWPATISFAGAVATYVYAYGVRDNTEKARAMFSNMAVTAENIANVIVTRNLLESDVTVTETVSTLATDNV